MSDKLLLLSSKPLGSKLLTLWSLDIGAISAATSRIEYVWIMMVPSQECTLNSDSNESSNSGNGGCRIFHSVMCRGFLSDLERIRNRMEKEEGSGMGVAQECTGRWLLKIKGLCDESRSGSDTATSASSNRTASCSTTTATEVRLSRLDMKSMVSATILDRVRPADMDGSFIKNNDPGMLMMHLLSCSYRRMQNHVDDLRSARNDLKSTMKALMKNRERNEKELTHSFLTLFNEKKREISILKQQLEEEKQRRKTEVLIDVKQQTSSINHPKRQVDSIIITDVSPNNPRKKSKKVQLLLDDDVEIPYNIEELKSLKEGKRLPHKSHSAALAVSRKK